VLFSIIYCETNSCLLIVFRFRGNIHVQSSHHCLMSVYQENLNPFADPRDLPISANPAGTNAPVGGPDSSNWPSGRNSSDGFSSAVLNDELVEQSFPCGTSDAESTKRFTKLPFSRDKGADRVDYQGTEETHGPVSSGGRYDDFETIDWVKDIARDRCRHRDLHSKRKTCLGGLRAYWDSGSGWFCMLAVGVITGIIACIIDIGSTWMSDLKEGVCLEAFWFNRDQCCWSSNQTDGVCEQWFTWSRLFMNKDPTGEYPDAYFVGYIFYVLFAILFSAVCVLLVRMFAPYACGSGIPEIKTILGGFIIRGYLGKWTLLIKSIGMVLGVAAGLSLGKEGPMVHMASCVGNIMAHFFPKYGRNEAKKREILSASAAAGVAVAFGAPIGGVLFSLEEASYYFPMKTMFRSFFCAMVSANVLRLLNPFGSDHAIMFYVDYKAQWHVMELFPFALLGMLGGIFGTIFNRANLYICRLRKSTWLGQYPVHEVLVVAMATALVSFPHTYLRMNTSALIRLLVSQCNPGDDWSICCFIFHSSDYRVNTSDPVGKMLGIYPAGPAMSTAMVLLTTALVLKLFMTVFTFGIKVPTGLFIPSLAAGAIMGRMLGVAIEQLVVAHATHPFVARMCKSSQPCINPALYAMVGAAATLGGVTRMTISLVVVMLELTGGLNYIIPLMIASMVSKWTGDRLTNGSIYEEHIRLNDYPYLGGHDELEHMWIAADVMQPSLFLFLSRPLFTSDRDRQLDLSITDDSPVYFADYSHDFQSENKGLTPVGLKNIVDLSPTTVTDQTPMETVLDFFRKLGLRQLLVTHNGCLLGILTKKDVLRHLLRHSTQNSS
ncbi:Chloride channel protein, partial [Fasciolopsis buskii]